MSKKSEKLHFLIPHFCNPEKQGYYNALPCEEPPLQQWFVGIRMYGDTKKPHVVDYFSASTLSWIRLRNTCVLPCDVPRAQAYFQMAVWQPSHNLRVYTKPLINTAAYVQGLQSTSHPDNWPKWDESVIRSMVYSLTYDECLSNSIPFKDFLPEILARYS